MSTPQTTAKAPSQASGLRRLAQKDTLSTESILGAGVATLLVHLLILFLIPLRLNDPSAMMPPSPTPADRLEILVEPPPPLPENFVQTNPEVPTNSPDKTRNFAARDQQAAQEEAARERDPDNTPKVEGENPDSNRIVQGSLEEPGSPALPQAAAQPSTPGPPPAPPPAQPQTPVQQTTASSEPATETASVATSPPPSQLAPDFLEAPPTEAANDPEGLASYSKTGENENAPEDDIEMADKTVPLTRNIIDELLKQALQGQTSPAPNPQAVPPVNPAPAQPQTNPNPSPQQASPQSPMPRPRIVRPASQGPLKNNPRGASATGMLAIDANFSEFGDYLARMFETIERKWNELNRHGRSSLSDSNSRVVIEFYITREGTIEGLQSTSHNASQAAEWRCIDAIESPAPYFPWTRDMIEILGERQPVRITFLYR